MPFSVLQFSVKLLGVGAIQISTDTHNLYIDTHNSINKAPDVKTGDILLFTHCDGDHFDPTSLPDLKEQKNPVIGPPNITGPLLKSGKVKQDQIHELTSPDKKNPSKLSMDFLNLSSFNTTHFIGWEPIHNSYMLEIEGISIFVTGDSQLNGDMRNYIGKADYFICNLVDEGYIKEQSDKRFAIHHHLSYMLNLLQLFEPKKILAGHLIGFDGTVDPGKMDELVRNYQFHDRIIIPQNSEDEIILS